MIYIDPPYNTGNDFIYPDNYADPLRAYLASSWRPAVERGERQRQVETARRQAVRAEGRHSVPTRKPTDSGRGAVSRRAASDGPEA